MSCQEILDNVKQGLTDRLPRFSVLFVHYLHQPSFIATFLIEKIFITFLTSLALKAKLFQTFHFLTGNSNKKDKRKQVWDLRGLLRDLFLLQLKFPTLFQV